MELNGQIIERKNDLGLVGYNRQNHAQKTLIYFEFSIYNLIALIYIQLLCVMCKGTFLLQIK